MYLSRLQEASDDVDVAPKPHKQESNQVSDHLGQTTNVEKYKARRERVHCYPAGAGAFEHNDLRCALESRRESHEIAPDVVVVRPPRLMRPFVVPIEFRNERSHNTSRDRYVC